LSPHWQRVYSGKMPPNIEWGKEKPDLWIKPESSVIVQVKRKLLLFKYNKCLK